MRVRGKTVVLLLVAIFGACIQSGPATTETKSDIFSSLSDKVEFLERYVQFKRKYERLEFNIQYRNNSDGCVPGPSDWDIRIVAKVPIGELPIWFEDFQSTSIESGEWIRDVPSIGETVKIDEWYTRDNVVVGIDRQNGIVAYRNQGI